MDRHGDFDPRHRAFEVLVDLPYGGRARVGRFNYVNGEHTMAVMVGYEVRAENAVLIRATTMTDVYNDDGELLDYVKNITIEGHGNYDGVYQIIRAN